VLSAGGLLTYARRSPPTASVLPPSEPS
jgi:hypothetical protein